MSENLTTEELIANAQKLQEAADAAKAAVAEQKKREREERRAREQAEAAARVKEAQNEHEFATEGTGDWIALDADFSGVELTIFDWSTPQSGVHLSNSDLRALREWLNALNI